MSEKPPRDLRDIHLTKKEVLTFSNTVAHVSACDRFIWYTFFATTVHDDVTCGDCKKSWEYIEEAVRRDTNAPA